MCLALLDGRACTAGELARATGVSPSTATADLDQLVHGGLLTDERQGRHRYLTLAGPGAADLVEDLAGRARAGLRVAPGSLRAVSASNALAERRHHLAGAVGAALCERMLVQRWIERTPRPRAVRVTATGAAHLRAQLGLAL